MLTVSVPYHLDEFLGGFAPGPVDVTVAAELPAGDRWSRMAVLYELVADVVAGAGQPVTLLSGDCTTSLGVLAGLQRAGQDPSVVWLDAHADFQTEATTASGYLGGMPLALAAGVGELTLPRLLGLRPLPAALLVGARDVDPPEEVLLAESPTVRRRPVDDLGPLPGGPLYLHVDLDVCDPADVPDLLYPAPGGPASATVLAALRQVVATGRVAAVGLALTWRLGGRHADRHDAVRDAARAAVGAAPA
jgi:arginase